MTLSLSLSLSLCEQITLTSLRKCTNERHLLTLEKVSLSVSTPDEGGVEIIRQSREPRRNLLRIPLPTRKGGGGEIDGINSGEVEAIVEEGEENILTIRNKLTYKDEEDGKGGGKEEKEEKEEEEEK